MAGQRGWILRNEGIDRELRRLCEQLTVTDRTRHVLARATTLVVAMLGIAASALGQVDSIRTKCAADWPTDFRMRVYCENQQTEAAGRLNGRNMLSGDQRLIRTKCASDWPADFKMRDYCEEQQLKALSILAPTPAPKRLRSLTDGPLSQSLLEKSEADVRASIGEPKEIAGARWSFTTEEDGEEADLKVYFDKGKVSDVRPRDVPLSTVTKRTKPPTGDASGEPPKPTVPSDAVARCGNGAYVYVSTGANTCKGFGGVSEWFKKQQ